MPKGIRRPRPVISMPAGAGSWPVPPARRPYAIPGNSHAGPLGWAGRHTIVANSTIAEERAVGDASRSWEWWPQQQPEHRGKLEHARAEERKSVVDVDDLWTVLAQHCLHIMAGFATQHVLAGSDAVLPPPLPDFVAAAAEPYDLVSGGRERRSLLVDETVLSAGSTRAVAVVDKQDPYLESVTCHHGRVAPPAQPRFWSPRAMRDRPELCSRPSSGARIFPTSLIENLRGCGDTSDGAHRPLPRRRVRCLWSARASSVACQQGWP